MKRPSGLTLLAGALLLLMPALAVLQFRWVGQVSDAEQERMRRTSRSRPVSSVNPSTEIQRVPRPRLSRNRTEGAVGTVRVPLRRMAQHDRPSGDGPTYTWLTRMAALSTPGAGNNGANFQQCQWPPILAAVASDFEAEFDRFGEPPTRGTRFQGQDALNPVRRCAAHPRRSCGAAPTGSRQQTSDRLRVHGYRAGPPYIQRQVLPDLTLRHFRHSSSDSYRLAVVDADEPDTVIFRSDETHRSSGPPMHATAVTAVPRLPRSGRDNRPAWTAAAATRRRPPQHPRPTKFPAAGGCSCSTRAAHSKRRSPARGSATWHSASAC